MLKPLTQFYCDTCGEIINSPEEGWIEWISKDMEQTHEVHSFRIVHQHSYSPLASVNRKGCYQLEGKTGACDNHLNHFLNEDYKMVNILQFLDIGPYHDPDYKGSDIADMRQYVEMVRRFTIPYYEEARHYWAEALEDGFFMDSNEISIYEVNNLKRIIERYGDK